jgi:N-acetylglucosaminyldiphosphoundecaprenol N-acetyl-beta-D-mannosaminyltransferase
MKNNNKPTCTILNVQVDNFSMTEAVSQIYHGFIVTLNVDHLIHLQKDEEFFNVYESADYRFCDSQIIMQMSRFLGTPIKEKITGSDFFPRFCQFHRANADIRIFLLGGASDSPDLAAKNINSRLGNSIIVGGYSPPFGFENDPHECTRIITLIKESGATVLAVGVGAPKQEKWIAKYRYRLPFIQIFMGIGATIDFEAGNLLRAPHWTQKVGLEWLYRLLSEPRRLWRRYLINDPPFFWLILKQRLGLYRSPFQKTPINAPASVR